MSALASAGAALAAILFNSLWEDVAIVAFVAALLRLVPRANASTRYAVWWFALVACLVLPVVTTLPFVGSATPASMSAAVPITGTQNRVVSSARSVSRTDRINATDVTASAVRVPSAHVHVSVPRVVAVVVAALWALAALAFLLRLMFGLLHLERLKRDALPLPVEARDDMQSWQGALKGGRDVRLCVSDETDVPVAVGLFDAMILIPRHLLEGLAHAELDQISLHELGHLRRADDWTNALQRIASALFFFNPAVRYIGTQLDIEREVACDDWVLNYTKAVRPYALCLTKMAETTSWPHRPVPAPGVFVTRKNISIRIERLLRVGRDIGTGISPAPAALAAACVIAVALVAYIVAPSFAFESPRALPTIAATPAPVETHIGVRIVSAPVTPRVTPPIVRRAVAVVAPAGAAPAIVATTAPTAPTPPTAPPHARMPRVVSVPAFSFHFDEAALQQEINDSLAKSAGEAGGKGCTGCDFARADYHGKDLHGARFVASNFGDVNFSDANLSGANLSGSNFEHANLRNANLRNAVLTGTNMESADLTGADLTGANLNGIHLEHATFGAAQARAIIAGCKGCSFSHLDLRGVDLSGLTITGDRFEGVDLSGADFSRSKVYGVEFVASNLSRINVNNAKFTGVELTNGTKTDGVDWSTATLVGMDLSKP